jgi:hypothetical protein
MDFIKVRDPQTGREYMLDLKSGSLASGNGDQKFSMDLTADDVHIQQALADAVVGYKLQDGIADDVVRVIPVSKQADFYYEWDKRDTFEQVASINAAPGATVPEIGTRLSSNQFSTRPYALAAFVPADVEANADSKVQPRRQAVRRLMNALTVAREYRIASMLRNAANYGAGFKTTLGATAKWNQGSTSNPVQDIYDRIEATGMPVTSMIVSERTWHDFALNTNVQRFGTYKDSIDPVARAESANTLTALLGLPPVKIGKMKAYNKTTGALEYVWGDDVVFTHEPQGEGLALDGQDIASAYTFRWTAPFGAMPGIDASMMPGGFFIRQYFAKERGTLGGTVIVVGHYDSDKYLSDFVSGLIVSAHQ